MGKPGKRHCLGVILAGGKSRRMGGPDKAGLELGGKPLVQLAYEKLLPQVQSLVISGPLNYGLPAPALPDPRNAPGGPLGGLLAASLWAREKFPQVGFMVTVPVDSPFFPKDLVSRLTHKGPGYVVTRQRAHPVFAAWPVDLEDSLWDYIEEKGHLSLLGFLEALKAEPVFFPNEKAFFNINSPEDLKTARFIRDKH